MAEESVCDGLKADGVTTGLYGLCIAFCEAQDWDGSCVEDPESCGKSASRILENYEKKQTASGPDMPCIVSASECPCWDGSEDSAAPGVAGLAALWQAYAPADCESKDICVDLQDFDVFSLFSSADCISSERV